MFQAPSSDIGDSLKRQPLPSNEKDIVLSLVPVSMTHICCLLVSVHAYTENIYSENMNTNDQLQ